MSRREVDDGTALRLEERAMNAVGSAMAVMYDGWLLGYRPGDTKRLRSINPFYGSTLPLEAKLAHCVDFYARAQLPAIFRLVPFSRPPELDGWLERAGWGAFGATHVLRLELACRRRTPSCAGLEVVDVVSWQPLAAPLLHADEATVATMIERSRSYPLPQAGAIVRRDDGIAACGLVKIEDDHAGLFAVHTDPGWRNQGLATALVGALLDEAARLGARHAYLQVTADNTAALSVYHRIGFDLAYDYWYRGRDGEQH
jgi:ribosomal protein S18 acetylase RimI-like enzyme